MGTQQFVIFFGGRGAPGLKKTESPESPQKTFFPVEPPLIITSALLLFLTQLQRGYHLLLQSEAWIFRFKKKQHFILKKTGGFPSSAQGTPPWILLQAGLETSGHILISSIGKTRRTAFFFFFKLNS